MNTDGCSGEMNLRAEKIHVTKMKGQDTTETDRTCRKPCISQAVIIPHVPEQLIFQKKKRKRRKEMGFIEY